MPSSLQEKLALEWHGSNSYGTCHDGVPRSNPVPLLCTTPPWGEKDAGYQDPKATHPYCQKVRPEVNRGILWVSVMLSISRSAPAIIPCHVCSPTHAAAAVSAINLTNPRAALLLQGSIPRVRRVAGLCHQRVSAGSQVVAAGELYLQPGGGDAQGGPADDVRPAQRRRGAPARAPSERSRRSGCCAAAAAAAAAAVVLSLLLPFCCCCAGAGAASTFAAAAAAAAAAVV